MLQENEQLKRDVDGAKTRADRIFRDRSEMLEQRDVLRAQLSKAMGISAETLPQLAVDTPGTNTAATIQREEALELISTIESEEEARAVCKEVGIRSDTTLSMDAMVMALKGYYDHELTVEQAFAANDPTGSGVLNSSEVQCAVAMLGYLVEEDALAVRSTANAYFAFVLSCYVCSGLVVRDSAVVPGCDGHHGRRWRRWRGAR